MRRPHAGRRSSLAALIVLLAGGSNPGRSILSPDGNPDAVAMAACAPWDGGVAARCGPDGACESAYPGWVHVRELVEGGSLVGDVHLELATRTPLDGTFDARWRETRRICR